MNARRVLHEKLDVLLESSQAETIQGVIVGRVLQGAGAISSTIMALVADLTRDEQRTKAMALLGISIGFSFALALIIGKPGRHIAEADVLSHIAGYTCFLDASVRDYQRHSVTAGKNFHRTGPLGPWMVTADEIPEAARRSVEHPDARDPRAFGKV